VRQTKRTSKELISLFLRGFRQIPLTVLLTCVEDLYLFSFGFSVNWSE
jgi:hypothetical protein